MTLPEQRPASLEEFQENSAEIPPPNRRDSGIVRRPHLRPEALAYQLLRLRTLRRQQLRVLRDSYRCWSVTWTQHLRERENIERLHSDNFTRQDEIGALTHEGEVVGLSAYRWVDLTNDIYHHDSYFAVWPRSAVESVCAMGSRVCIGSNLTVPEKWRNASGVSIKELLLALAIDRFLRSAAAAMVGTMRNDRGMHSLAYRLGFRPLVRDVPLHGGPVDLVVFDRRGSHRPSLGSETESIIARLAAGGGLPRPLLARSMP